MHHSLTIGQVRDIHTWALDIGTFTSGRVASPGSDWALAQQVSIPGRQLLASLQAGCEAAAQGHWEQGGCPQMVPGARGAGDAAQSPAIGEANL